MADVNNQANNWVWDYLDTVRNFCKKYFPQDPPTVEDMTHSLLLRISQRDGLDQVKDRSKWMRTAARNECMDYFRELKRHPDWKGEPLEDPGVGADEELLDEKLDKGVRESIYDIESETDAPDSKNELEKIDPIKFWSSFKRRDPQMAAALKRSLFFVAQAFSSIKLDRVALEEAEQVAKLLAVLQDAKRRTDKICGTFADQAFQDYEKTLAALQDARRRADKRRDTITKSLLKYCAHFLGVERDLELTIVKNVEDQLKEVLGSVGAFLRWEKKNGPFPWSELRLFDEGDGEHDSRSPIIFHFTDVTLLRSPHREFNWNSRRIRAFVHSDPDPLYVLYRIWNQILKKGREGREGKYGNRKLLKNLFFVFKKMTEGREDFDIFSSLTEETNFETLRTMSYRLNKGYSELADFIFRKSVHPPKSITPPTGKKKPDPSDLTALPRSASRPAGPGGR